MSRRWTWISYESWEHDLRRRGLRRWRFIAVLLVAWALSIWVGGWAPLLAVPVSLIIDYGWTCQRLSTRPAPASKGR